jgi:[acyl-carrier-protein] S-malonyltransferase
LERDLKTAFLFPGQGAHQIDMVEELTRLPDAKPLLDVANDVAGIDLVDQIRRQGPACLRRNEVVSLVTAVYSLAAYLRLTSAGVAMDLCAGYSVGQWTAMAAAGMVSHADLMQIIWHRAQCMNGVPNAEQGAMLAVIGLKSEAVRAACEQVSTPECPVEISNYNCIGQVTVSGHRAAVDGVRRILQDMGPRRLVDLEVSGAWHCRMMTPACEPFAEKLAGLSFKAPRVPIADNVTGELLPESGKELFATLIRHLDHAVLWEQGMKSLVARGVERFIEVGYGNALTKIGFFIDRCRQHITYQTVLQHS